MTPLLDTRGNMTPKGAADLAHTIREFWLAQGYEGIETWVETQQTSPKQLVHVVRSNMRNGVPPRWKEDATTHLMRSPANARRLDAAIAEISAAGQLVRQNLDSHWQAFLDEDRRIHR